MPKTTKKKAAPAPVVKSLNNATKPANVADFNEEAEKLYKERRKLAAQKSRLDSQSLTLKENIKKIDRDLITLARLQDGGYRKMSNGKIVFCKFIPVEARVQSVAAYSYYKFTEE